MSKDKEFESTSTIETENHTEEASVVSENNELENKKIDEEVSSNQNKITDKDKVKDKAGKGYDFADKNIERLSKKEQQIIKNKNSEKNIKKNVQQVNKKIDQKVKKMDSKRVMDKIFIGALVVIFIFIGVGLFDKGDFFTKNTPTKSGETPVSKDISDSKVLAGKSMYDIEFSIEDARIVDKEIQIKFILKNNSENAYFPILNNSRLLDNTKKEYVLNGAIVPQLPNGVEPGNTLRGLLIFGGDGNNAKDYTINLFGSDVAHFTFNYEVPFTIK